MQPLPQRGLEARTLRLTPAGTSQRRPSTAWRRYRPECRRSAWHRVRSRRGCVVPPRAPLQSLVQASLAPLCQPGAFRCPWRNSQRSSPPAAHSHRPGLGAQQRHLRPRGQPQPERGLARVGLRAAAQRGGQGLLRAVAGAPPGFRRPVHAGPRDRGRACLRRPITLMRAGCSGSCCWRLF